MYLVQIYFKFYFHNFLFYKFLNFLSVGNSKKKKSFIFYFRKYFNFYQHRICSSRFCKVRVFRWTLELEFSERIRLRCISLESWFGMKSHERLIPKPIRDLPLVRWDRTLPSPFSKWDKNKKKVKRKAWFSFQSKVFFTPLFPNTICLNRE